MGDEDDGAIPGFLEEERPDRRDDDDADGCGGSGGCRVLISLVRAGTTAVELSVAVLCLPLLKSRTDS